MNSSTSRVNERRQTQDEIKRQIALLQTQLNPEPERVLPHPARSPKRKTPSTVALAPPTPSPKKKRKLEHKRNATDIPIPRLVSQAGPNVNQLPQFSGKGKLAQKKEFIKPAPSNLLNKLASLCRKTEPDEPIQRSTAFAENPPQELVTVPKRDDRLVLVEELEPGPYEHSPTVDDPIFEKLEPHSGINLVSRTIPHDELKDYLRGRYYLSPSRLYSVIRLLPDKQGYDVPVPGDWVTIAVIAERGPIKFTRAPVTLDRDEQDAKRRDRKGKSTPNDNNNEKPSGGKKYVNLKLIDFGARSGGNSSATGGQSVIRGDAFLSLLLFEADGFDTVSRGDGRKPEKLYRGGSGGAFEHLTAVREGDVIALLNPKILKPFQRSNDKPHPVDNILAVTPESHSSIMVIGRAKDLGMCTVRKQDGKVCGSWCDKRVSDVCDYHVQHAVKRRRAARPEFSAGTSGLSTSATHKRKHDYDPLRQWGLKPEESSAASGARATYVVSGHVVNGTSSDPRTMYVTENIGRDGQAKAKRKLEAMDADKALKSLLERDKEGMQSVIKAREAGALKEVKDVKQTGKGKDNTSQRTALDDEKREMQRKSSYSAEFVKSLGFNPSLKAGQRISNSKHIHEKLEVLEATLTSRKDIVLGPRPGPKIRSGVVAPGTSNSNSRFPANATSSNQDENMVDLDDF